MSFKYLGKQRQVNPLGQRTWAQLINVPSLERHQRCPFCAFYQLERTPAEYQDCVAKHKCGNESLLWCIMTNSMNRSWWKPQYFSPTLQLRQLKINYAPRYLQYISADIDGYQCNSYCQYYPERIEAGTTVADCAASHACGKNGSFFDILTPANMSFDSVPDFDTLPLLSTDFVTFSGQVISNPSNISKRLLSDGLVQIRLDDSDWYYILNWLSGYPTCCSLLKQPVNLPRTAHFEGMITPYEFQPDEMLVLTSLTSRLGNYLTSQGLTNRQMQLPFYNYAELSITENTTGLFTSETLYWEVVEVHGSYIFLLTDIKTLTKYMFKMTGRNGMILGSPIYDATPSVLRWIDNPWATGETYQSITIEDYYSEFASWLRNCGCRPSLFY